MLLTEAQRLKDETMDAAVSDVPTLGIAIIDGLLMPLALIEAVPYKEAKSEEVRESVREIRKEVLANFEELTNGLLAAAKALGRTAAAVPATGLAIDTFLSKLHTRQSFFDRLHALSATVPAIRNLETSVKSGLLEHAARIDKTLGSLFWLRDLRRNRWNTAPGVCSLVDVLNGSLNALPPRCRDQFPP